MRSSGFIFGNRVGRRSGGRRERISWAQIRFVAWIWVSEGWKEEGGGERGRLAFGKRAVRRVERRGGMRDGVRA